MRIPPEALTSDSRILLSVDETEIYAEAIGDSAKPAIVFIHGILLSSVVFDDIFNDLSWCSELYLIRYDIRGHGRSGKPDNEDAWDSQRFAQDFDTVVQAFGLKKPFVAGWCVYPNVSELQSHPSVSIQQEHRRYRKSASRPSPKGLTEILASCIADILAFQPTSYLSGIIYIAPLPHMGDIMNQVLSSVCFDCLPSFAQNEDVDAYQEAANSFIVLCSSSMSHSMRLACLGSFLIQPRFIATNVLAREQNEEGWSKAGAAGLPSLLLLGKDDNIVVNNEILGVMEGWKDLKVVEMRGDHMVWLGDLLAFRRAVLAWVGTAAARQSE
ncbi:hypothetical protein H0H81_008258 [Sphagnurus paluster]|uniref:AB hydrolase-1 domain-containing protein n=1 Tax=Sphagnurus paluster TaxID=117069 RepID=A0A9P7GK47_9AGAR|nr:hypothetical protein H0H81_008258 [Sphagnurus paluster]